MGERSLTTVSPIDKLPVETCSRPAININKVDLPCSPCQEKGNDFWLKNKEKCGWACREVNPVDVFKKVRNSIEDNMKLYGVQTRISEFGATSEDIDKLVDDVVSISFGADNLLASNPPMTRDDIKNIYHLSL